MGPRDRLEKAIRARLTEVEATYIMALADIYAVDEAARKVNKVLEELAKGGRGQRQKKEEG